VAWYLPSGTIVRARVTGGFDNVVGAIGLPSGAALSLGITQRF
jgi:hypothetical protein